MTTTNPTPRKSPVPLSGLASLVLLAALVVGNVALSRCSVRADLTEDRLYSLSDATRNVLRKLSEAEEMLAQFRRPARRQEV